MILIWLSIQQLQARKLWHGFISLQINVRASSRTWIANGDMEAFFLAVGARRQ